MAGIVLHKQWIKVKYLTVVIIILVTTVEVIIRYCVTFSVEKEESGEYFFDDQSLHMTALHVKVINNLFFVGHAVANFVGGFISDLYGGRFTISLSLLAVSIIALVFPFVIIHTPWYVVATVYFTLGWMQGLTIPANYAVLAHWIPNYEMTFLVGSIDSCLFIGRIIIVYLAHYLILRVNKFWTNMFQMWGGFGVMLSVIALIFVHSSPWQYKMAGQQERSDMESVGSKRPKRINWKKIIQDEAVWGVTFQHVGHKWLFYVLSGELEKIGKDKIEPGDFPLEMSIDLWIIITNIGVSCLIVNKLINVNWIPTVYMRWLCTIIGDVLPSVPIIMMNQIKTSAKVKSTLMGSAFFLKSVHYAGGQVNVLDLTRHYAGTIIGFQNTIAGLVWFLIQLLTEALGKASSDEWISWSKLYELTLGVCFVTMLLYLIWGRAERAHWDVVVEEDEEEEFLEEFVD